MKIRFIFETRPLCFMFYKNWYSLYRFKNVQESYYGEKLIIDIGIFSIGFAWKNKMKGVK